MDIIILINTHPIPNPGEFMAQKKITFRVSFSCWTYSE